MGIFEIFSIAMTVLGTIIPQVIPYLPHTAANVVSGAAAALGAVYHLYQAPPSSK